MWNRIPVQKVVMTIAVFLSSVVGAQYITRSGLFASPVEALNYSIQKRFQTLEGFGMARMPVVPQHVYEFDPQTPDERAAVAELREQGWTVNLYLGGRGLLEPPMSKAEWEQAGEYSDRKAISDPMRISGNSTPADLPKPWELWEIGQKALAASTTGDRFTSSFRRWRVDARPIRANKQACLKCHDAEGAGVYPPRPTGPRTKLEIGDALGVVLYVYARVPE